MSYTKIVAKKPGLEKEKVLCTKSAELVRPELEFRCQRGTAIFAKKIHFFKKMQKQGHIFT
jgi:hypothetical protein